MRFIVALLLAVHGVAHLVGFAGAFRLSANIPYKTSVLAGRLDVGNAGAKLLGVLWLALAIAFVLASAAAAARAPFWPGLALGVSLLSLGACLVALPEARIGAIVNAALIAVLLTASAFHWLPHGD